MRKRGGGRRHDLQKGVHVLGLVVVVRRVRVQFLDVGRDDGFFALGRDDVLVDAAEQSPLDVPEEDGARVPGTSRARADHGLDLGLGGLGGLGMVVRVGVVLGDGGPLFAVGGSRGIGGGGCGGTGGHFRVTGLSGAAGSQLLLCQATGIEILDDTGAVRRRGRDLSAAEKEGAERDVPETELPVLEDDDAVKPRHQEDGDYQAPGGADADDGARNLGVAQRHLVAAALPEQQHAEQWGGNAEVDGHHRKGLVDRVWTEQHAVLGDKEDDGREGSREAGRDDPGEEDRDDAVVDARADPLNAVGTDGRNTHANNTAHDGVGGGDR